MQENAQENAPLIGTWMSSGSHSQLPVSDTEDQLHLCTQPPEAKSKEDKRGGKIDWASLDNVIETLSRPATRARYFVAELGVKRMLGKGTSIDAQDTAGLTPLHLAAAKGRTDQV